MGKNAFSDISSKFRISNDVETLKEKAHQDNLRLRSKVRNLEDNIYNRRQRIDSMKNKTNEILHDNGCQEGLDSNYATRYPKFERIFRETPVNHKVEFKRKNFIAKHKSMNSSCFMDKAQNADRLRN